MPDFSQKNMYVIPGFEVVTWWREVDVHHFDHRWAVMSYILRIPPTFLDEFLAETSPRCFPRECQPYIPFVTDLSNFRGVMAIFPDIAETSNPSNFLFIYFLVQRWRAWCSLSIKCRPKISAYDVRNLTSSVHVVSCGIFGWSSSYCKPK